MKNRESLEQLEQSAVLDTPSRLFDRQRLANRFALYMLAMLAILLVSGVWELMNQIREARLTEDIIEKWHPISVDALEMEINALGVMLTAVSYDNAIKGESRLRIARNQDAFERAYARLRSLAEPTVTRHLDGIDELWRELSALIEQPWTAKNRARKIERLTEIHDLLDGLLDEHLQPLADTELSKRYVSWQRQMSEDTVQEIVVLAALLIGGVTLIIAVRSRLQFALSSMIAGTEAIAGGDLTFRLRINRDDELGVLALRFNYMARQLHKTMVSRNQLVVRERQLEEANQELRSHLEEKAAFEAALRLSASEWQSTFDSVTTAIVILDAEQKVRRLNVAAAGMLGSNASAAIGRSLESVAHDKVWHRMLDLLANDESIPVSRSTLVSEGDRVWSLTTDKDAVSGFWTLQVIDVSEIFSLRRDLLAAEPAADLGRFVAGVAHEVRNPLFAIMANLEAWKEQPGEGFSTFGARIESSASRLVALMTDLMEMARPSEPSLANVEAASLIASVIGACSDQAARSSVVLETDIPEGLKLHCDASRLEQAIGNLVENAISFSSPGGKVEIMISRQPRTVLLTVRDRGPGIAEDDLPLLFEPFFTQRRGGTGLGLSIVRRIAEDHGGGADVENRRGGGADFWIELPIGSGRSASRLT